MADEKLGRDGPEDPASSYSPNEDNLPDACANTKGKQKAGLGFAASHLEASRKLVVNAITTARDLPNLASGSKVSNGSGYLGSSSSIAGESSSFKVHRQTSFEQIRKTSNHCQNDLFDDFVKGSTNVLGNDDYRLDLFETSFTNQETSDGFAVAELLSLPEAESFETSLGLEYDVHPPRNDDQWNEAVILEPGNQEGEERLDFTPDFITRPESSQQEVSYLGTDDIQEARSTWLGYWNDVFTAYNARVWGNSPIPTFGILERKEAQRDNSNSEPTAVSQALSRLKQIFYHLKG